MKEVVFLGDSLDWIHNFPADARQDADFQIDRAQYAEDPDDWKPMKGIGKGMCKIRIREADGQYRMILSGDDARWCLYPPCFLEEDP